MASVILFEFPVLQMNIGKVYSVLCVKAPDDGDFYGTIVTE